jgi:3-deoxy-7-phosphoheptulonate synthase
VIIELKHTSTETEKQELLKKLESLLTSFKWIAAKNLISQHNQHDSAFLKNESCIERITETDTPYQLASVQFKKQTSFDVKGATIGNDAFQMMAGPCAIETESQIEETAAFLSSLGVKFIRGGAYKPRTSPYSFRGLGLDGLRIIRKAADKYDLRVVTEIMDISLLEEVYEYADILQVGSRNMHNFSLLDALGKVDKPILLKRGMHARVNEWLLAAEYILSGGNEKVILCERGIRSFDNATRNVMDVGVIPLLKELSHLPVIADPSHGTGQASRVEALSLAAVAAGANGLLIEVHPNPSKALSDSYQAVSFDNFKSISTKVETIKECLKTFSTGPESILKLQSF